MCSFLKIYIHIDNNVSNEASLIISKAEVVKGYDMVPNDELDINSSVKISFLNKNPFFDLLFIYIYPNWWFIESLQLMLDVEEKE